MNVAVAQGAGERLSFVGYIDWLEASGWVVPTARPLLEQVRRLGNEANHVIDARPLCDAELALRFVKYFLEAVYEIPALTAGDKNKT